MNEKAMRLLKEYLNEAKLMQVATSNGNKPWVASVWYVHDNNLNLYWISRKARRHSIELGKNPNVAGAIVKPHTIGSGQKVRGVQFEGTARPCNAVELIKAYKLYTGKYRRAEKIPAKELLSKAVKYTYYKITPKSFVLFDEVNFPKDPRQEIKL